MPSRSIPPSSWDQARVDVKASQNTNNTNLTSIRASAIGVEVMAVKEQTREGFGECPPNAKRPRLTSLGLFNSGGWTRTNDRAVNSRLLYRLSYAGMFALVPLSGKGICGTKAYASRLFYTSFSRFRAIKENPLILQEDPRDTIFLSAYPRTRACLVDQPRCQRSNLLGDPLRASAAGFRSCQTRGWCSSRGPRHRGCRCKSPARSVARASLARPPR